MIPAFKGEYGFLSNFYPSPMTLPSGKVAKTVEHAFQAYKALSTMEFDRVLAAITPTEAKRIGRSIPIRPGWDLERDEFMRQIVRMKFLQNPDLMAKLKATGDEELVEGNDWGDTYWGRVDGKGENMLGKILMEVRSGKV